MPQGTTMDCLDHKGPTIPKELQTYFNNKLEPLLNANVDEG